MCLSAHSWRRQLKRATFVGRVEKMQPEGVSVNRVSGHSNVIFSFKPTDHFV